MLYIRLFYVIAVCYFSFGQAQEIQFNYKLASKWAEIPLDCIIQEYPNKLGQVLNGSEELQTPSVLHPIFYGCFDWHSSVHGHWLLTKLMNDFPNTELSEKVTRLWDQQFTPEKVKNEIAYFQIKYNKSFERTYGWAWLLKLQDALEKSENPQAEQWKNTLQPLVDTVIVKYKTFLPKLVYPIRVGEHTNTAFGLYFALEYARRVKDRALEELIVNKSRDFYLNDCNCPIEWEPSGFDFLSPCLQEAYLMSEVLAEKEFNKWLKKFMPSILKGNFSLTPGSVLDRTDGKLVHLDGLNFSRAWCLYGLANHLPEKNKLKLTSIADNHINASIGHVNNEDYMGSHWLASFLLYAIEMKLKVE